MGRFSPFLFDVYELGFIGQVFDFDTEEHVLSWDLGDLCIHISILSVGGGLFSAVYTKTILDQSDLSNLILQIRNYLFDLVLRSEGVLWKYFDVTAQDR